MRLDVPISESIILILSNFCEHFVMEEQNLNLRVHRNNNDG